MGTEVSKPSPTTYEQLRMRFPTVERLRDHARNHSAGFAFEFADGGAGADRGILRNHAAFDAIEIVPSIGTATAPPSIDVDLFGTRYAAPIGIAAMGGPAVVLPGADLMLAKAAQQARIPYTLGLVGSAAIEQIAEVAPDVFWFQIYRCAENEHELAFDLMRRADAAGAKALILTLDVPVRTTRTRELVAGLQRSKKFRPTFRMLCDIAGSPRWALAMLKYGPPQFANFQKYVRSGAGVGDVYRYVQGATGGAFSWDEIARYRDRWPGPMIAKGVLNPADAEKAVALGFDGIMVSNMGGRQSEALPASIDCVPWIADAVGSRATVMMDSGVRSGTDVVRALAAGAVAAFAGKAFLWGLGALGARGPQYVIEMLREETIATLMQIGAKRPEDARLSVCRHANAFERLPPES